MVKILQYLFLVVLFAVMAVLLLSLAYIGVIAGAYILTLMFGVMGFVAAVMCAENLYHVVFRR